MELYLLRTEFITLYGINITVQSTEVFILPSIFPSYKNIVKMKKKVRYIVGTYNSLSSCGAFICLVCKCYSKLSQGFVSATLLLRLALTSPSVAHRNALRLHLEMLCSKCDNISICTAMPVNFQSLFQQDNVYGANIPASVQKWERIVPSSSCIWKRLLKCKPPANPGNTVWPGTFVAKIQSRQPRPLRPINLLWITEHRVQLSTCLWPVGSFLLGHQVLQQLVLLLQRHQCFQTTGTTDAANLK